MTSKNKNKQKNKKINETKTERKTTVWICQATNSWILTDMNATAGSQEETSPAEKKRLIEKEEEMKNREEK